MNIERSNFMSNLYLITGPAGVGKSTVSKELALSLKKSVLLEGDDFYHQVINSYIPAWKEGNHLNIFWKVVIDTINNYLNAGYDVIFNYIIPKDKFNELKSIFKKYNTKFIVLLASESTIIKRDNKRDIKNRMNERCILLLREFINYNYDKKYILDTDNYSIKELVNKILDNNKYNIN